MWIVWRREVDRRPDSVRDIFQGAGRAVASGDHLDQIEAQAAAAGAPAAGGILPVKCFKDMGQGVFLDMGSGVLYGQGRIALADAAPHPDDGSLRRVEGSIGKEIADGFSQKPGSQETKIPGVRSAARVCPRWASSSA